MAYQLAKVAKEVKRNIETTITGNYASLIGSTSSAGTLGSIEAWLETNDNRGSGGSDADEGTAWDALHDRFDARRINHSVAFSDDGVCTNQAESFFSRLRRSELGVHHHFSAQYLHQYANEMAWREDHRRKSRAAISTATRNICTAI